MYFMYIFVSVSIFSIPSIVNFFQNNTIRIYDASPSISKGSIFNKKIPVRYLMILLHGIYLIAWMTLTIINIYPDTLHAYPVIYLKKYFYYFL